MQTLRNIYQVLSMYFQFLVCINMAVFLLEFTAIITLHTYMSQYKIYLLILCKTQAAFRSLTIVMSIG